MILDTSAVIAILNAESEAAAFAQAIGGAPNCTISAANFFEAAIIADSKTRGPLPLDEFMQSAGINVAPVTIAQIQIARRAYQTYGRGNHPAKLNFGDCFAYALAQESGLPLLFKGEDFAQTDVRPAI